MASQRKLSTPVDLWEGILKDIAFCWWKRANIMNGGWGFIDNLFLDTIKV
jgi:hypothetical protein